MLSTARMSSAEGTPASAAASQTTLTFKKPQMPSFDEISTFYGPYPSPIALLSPILFN
jgi:hypothetical protein